MKRVPTVPVGLLGLLTAVACGCGAPGGGPNEDDTRDPQLLAEHVAYTTVYSSIDEIRDFLGPSPGPNDVASAIGQILESREYFVEFAADERLNEEIYGPVLEIWDKMAKAESAAEITAGLKDLRAHMSKFPKPDPVATAAPT